MTAGSRFCKRPLGLAQGTVVALAVCSALLALPTVAAAAGTGSIAGTVTEEAGSHEPIVGVEVCALEEYEEEGYAEYEYVKCANTESGGVYKITGLAPGTYAVEFSTDESPSINFVTQFYDKAASLESATAIDLTAGEERTAIDAELALAGKILGRVLNASGAPVAEVIACALQEVAGKLQAVECEADNANGEYTISKLPTGTYKVGFLLLSAEGYVNPQYFQSTTSIAAATPVGVKAGESTSLAPSVLQKGGEITGTVTDDTIFKAPIGETYVCAVAVGGGAEGHACAFTNAQGEYAISGLASGEYAVLFTGQTCTLAGEGALKCVKQYTPQYYDGKAMAAEADHVTVTAPQTTSGIDGALQEASPRPPTSTATPTLVGENVVGATLTCSTGAWAHGPTSISYEWRRNGAPIKGQTGDTYVVQRQDARHAISCVVTVSNSAGYASATSNAVHIAEPLPGTAVAARAARVRHERADVRLRCQGAGACKGSLKLIYKRSIWKVLGRRGKTHVNHVVKRVPVGRAHFMLEANGHETLKVKLTAAGGRLVARAGKHGLKVKLTGSDIRSRTLVLRGAKKGKRHGKHRGHEMR